MDRYLVTGAAGNLARCLLAEMDSRNLEVLGTDLSSVTVPEVPGTEIRGIDIRDTVAMTAVIGDFRPDVIIHMASLLSTTSEADPSVAWEVNANASFRLLEAARDAGCRQFFYPGTGASYGGSLPTSLPEDFPQWPGNIYGVTKIAVERLGAYFGSKGWLDFRALRFPMVISPYAPKGAVSAYASHAFGAALRNEPFVFPVDPGLGIASVYVKDAILGVLSLLNADQNSITRAVYNIHGFSPTAQEIARAIAERISGFDYTFVPDAHIMSILGPLPSVHEDTCARRDWGWEPEYGLQETVEAMLNH